MEQTTPNPYQTYISMLDHIEQDNLELIKETTIAKLSTSPQWPDISSQLLYKAVIHNSHKIIIFMLQMFPQVLTDNIFNLQVLRHAVRNVNVDLVKIMLNHGHKLMISRVDYNMYDCIVQDALSCYYSKIEAAHCNHMVEEIVRAKKIIKLLIEYPKNQFHQLGINLLVDEATMEIDLSISEADINKLYDNETVLEMYVNRIKMDGNKDSKLKYLIQLFRNVIYCLVREVVRLKMCKFVVSARNERVISSNEDLKSFARKCEDEISEMFGYSIVDDNLSVKVSDLIADTWVKYSCTENITWVIFSKEFKDKFPVYWRSIARLIFQAVAERSRLINSAPPFW